VAGYIRKGLKLVFADEEFEGLVVYARRLTIGQLLDLTALQGLKNLADDSPEVREKLQEVFNLLASLIKSWNLEELADEDDEDGPRVPVPVTGEALAQQDLGLVMAMINAIQDASAGVSAPLDRSSSAGQPSLELSLPMETLSPSLESLLTPA
jgi:hypothetical protein